MIRKTRIILHIGLLVNLLKLSVQGLRLAMETKKCVTIFDFNSLEFSDQFRQCSSNDLAETNSLKINCSPRNVPVSTLNSVENGVEVYIPNQVMIKKCSGICEDSNRHFECIPSQSVNRTVSFY